MIHCIVIHSLARLVNMMYNHQIDPSQSTNHYHSKSTTQSPKTSLYWQIPKEGGTTLKFILGKCLNLVQASRTSSKHLCNAESKELYVCKTKLGPCVNADTSDDYGIQCALHMELVPSGLVDVIVSSRFLHALTLFDSNNSSDDHKGQAFTLIRHPIERTVSTFYYLQISDWEPTYNVDYKNMSLLQYAQGDKVPSD